MLRLCSSTFSSCVRARVRACVCVGMWVCCMRGCSKRRRAPERVRYGCNHRARAAQDQLELASWSNGTNMCVA
eukprot:14016379-Alexandrium_andersonii.AAC.1